MKIIKITGIVLIILGVITAGWMYTRPEKPEEEIIGNRVAKLIDLPQGKMILATVTDLQKLKDQELFKKAQNGDKVLMFPDSGMAVIYRPLSDKIIEVGSIATVPSVIEAKLPTPTAEVKTVKKIKVAVYNGSGRAGMAADLAENVLAKIDTFEVVGKGDAVNNYPMTIIVDNSGQNQAVAEALAQELKGEISPLPEGEKVVSAEMIIIVGQNYQ